MILPTSYFPNIYYLSLISQNNSVEIDIHEHFCKKTYRNRSEILTANGKLTLSVPIIKSKEHKQVISEAQIDYSTDWQKQHFKSIESAYQSSPFYEYIIDDFSFVFEEKIDLLKELNLSILRVISEYINFNTIISTSESFQIPDETETIRTQFKNSNPIFKKAKYLPYHQTFSERFHFMENLSVLDLLFNCGARAKDYLLLK